MPINYLADKENKPNVWSIKPKHKVSYSSRWGLVNTAHNKILAFRNRTKEFHIPSKGGLILFLIVLPLYLSKYHYTLVLYLKDASIG
jgi:hypothetical protein